MKRIPRQPKVYESKAWLSRQTVILGKKPDQIAREQGVDKTTIYRLLEKHGLK